MRRLIEEVPGANDSEVTVRSALPVGSGSLEQAPGNPGRLRLLAETSSAQRAPLADAAERVQGIDTTHWSSTAQDGYLRRRDELARQWQDAFDIHAAVSERVNQHNLFVHQLPHLWESYRNSPENLRHLRELHDEKAADFVRFLVAQAAKLDELAQALEPVKASAERGRPVQPQEPVADAGLEVPEGQEEPDELGEQEGDSTTQEEAWDDEPAPDPVLTFEQQLRERELLTEQLQNGRRVERIPYRGLAA